MGTDESRCERCDRHLLFHCHSRATCVGVGQVVSLLVLALDALSSVGAVGRGVVLNGGGTAVGQPNASSFDRMYVLLMIFFFMSASLCGGRFSTTRDMRD